MPTSARGREATTLIAIRCRECARTFTHTEATVTDYQLRGLHPPRRCPACLEFARTERGAAMVASNILIDSLRGRPDPPTDPST